MSEIASIQQRISQIEELQSELKITKEMLKAELDNDPEYHQAAEDAKAAVAKKKQFKDTIYNTPANQKMVATIKENTEELKTLQEILSAELYRHYEANKTDEVTGADGSTRKFKVSVKLLPKYGSSGYSRVEF